MYTDIVQWALIREKVLKRKAPIRQINRETGIHRSTIRKILKHKFPPGHQRSKPTRHSKLGSHLQYIHALLSENEMLPEARRLSIKDIFVSLRKERVYDGGYSTVRDYVRKIGGETRCSKKKESSKIRENSPDVLELTYSLLTSLPKADAVGLLGLLSQGESPVISERKIAGWFRDYEIRSNKNSKPSKREIARQEERNWMHAVMQKSISRDEIGKQIGDFDGLEQLLDRLYKGGLNERNRSLCVLAEAKGFPRNTIYSFLDIHKKTGRKYIESFKLGGIDGLYSRKNTVLKKADDDVIKKAVFSTLHEPPSSHGINRTTWKRKDLVAILRNKGISVSKDIVGEITKGAGFRWRKARTVLTSVDPEYREKLARIQNILHNLQADEAFFSIDEYGPFAVNKKGGRKLVGPAEVYTVPQWQTSRGSLIMTAALELSRNQVTHFYSDKKNTEEIIRLMDILVEKYRTHKKIWLSWDAASWHASKKLYDEIEKANATATVIGGPIVDTAPLPAGAQFLNVIESVFSGMARSIIHNSDYQSADEVRSAIDQYFEDRNKHFLRNPRRAGKKIWGEERVISAFNEANNCKDPAYR